MTTPRRLAVALEASTAVGSAAARAGERRVERSLGEGSVHGRALVPALAECVRVLGARPSDIDLVVAGVGPGSYTGLRVAVAAARTLAFARSCPLLGVPSTEAVAHAAPGSANPVAVLFDARRDEVYLAVYDRAGSGLREEVAPRLVAARDLGRWLRPGMLALGDGAEAHAEILRALDVEVGQPSAGLPGAEALLEIGLARFAERGGDDPDSVRPLYLRASAAEEKRAARRSEAPADPR